MGTQNHADFAAACELLAETADSAASAAASSVPPDLVLIFQVFPGAVPQRTVEQIRQYLPQTPIAAVLGSWCEGEPRTGRPYLGVERVYWYQFPSWWDRFARGHQLVLSSKTQGFTTVLIDCSYRETFEALADTLPPKKCASIWLKQGSRWPLFRGAISGIWVGGQLTEAESPALQRLAGAVKPAHGRLVAMLDFPRHDRVAQALRMGADAVLGMPWRDEELCHALGIVREEKAVASPTIDQRDAA